MCAAAFEDFSNENYISLLMGADVFIPHEVMDAATPAGRPRGGSKTFHFWIRVGE
jgi:hypothetical protein